MKRVHLVALGAGLLFGLGLAVSGMTLPSKVTGFLDFAGSWDPTLMAVMGGAIGVHALVYWLVRRRPSPIFVDRFHLPTRADIDARLLIGAGIFGIGWGLAGYCPGPAIVSLVAGRIEVVAFVAAMLVSMWTVGRLLDRASHVSS